MQGIGGKLYPVTMERSLFTAGGGGANRGWGGGKNLSARIWVDRFPSQLSSLSLGLDAG